MLSPFTEGPGQSVGPWSLLQECCCAIHIMWIHEVPWGNCLKTWNRKNCVLLLSHWNFSSFVDFVNCVTQFPQTRTQFIDQGWKSEGPFRNCVTEITFSKCFCNSESDNAGSLMKNRFRFGPWGIFMLSCDFTLAYQNCNKWLFLFVVPCKDSLRSKC